MRMHTGKLCQAAAGNINAQSIEYYIETAQSVRCFESDELSAFGLMLRAALIEGAARACTEEMDEEERLLLFSDAIKTLNFLTTFDFSQIVERQSRLEQIFSHDPSGIYLKMEERSRALYRKRLASIARRRHISETDAANMAIKLANGGKTPREKHVGFYILDKELDREKSPRRGKSISYAAVGCTGRCFHSALGYIRRTAFTFMDAFSHLFADLGDNTPIY